MLRYTMARLAPIGSSSIVVRSFPKAMQLTLNREAALNALDLDMVRALHGTYKAAAFGDTAPNSILFLMRGAGSKAFCAGGDVVSLTKNQPDQVRQDFFYEEYQVNHMIATMNQPQVSLWDGIVMGGGFGVSVHGRHRIATTKTLFSMPETAIGLFPDVGGTYVLPRLPHRGIGMYLGLTGARLKGADVYHAGLATAFVSDPAAISELWYKLCSIDKVDVGVIDAMLADATKASKPEATKFSLAPHLDLIADLFGDESIPNVASLLSKLSAKAESGNEFCKSAVQTMRKCSPFSLEVTFAMLRHGAKVHEITGAFQAEYCATQHLMARKDFDAGVTALLIDKSGAPVWEHPNVEAVKPAEIKAIFQRPPGACDWHPTRPRQHTSSL